jgi:hypothetical protein
MGTEDLAGDGSYKATIYMNECEQAAAEHLIILKLLSSI